MWSVILRWSDGVDVMFVDTHLAFVHYKTQRITY